MWTKKITSEKAIFCLNTVFSLYFKFRARKIYATKALNLSRHFLFQRDQNHYSNMISKVMKICEQIVKKIDGRSPETTRSGNPFNCNPTTHQTKRASTNLWLSSNKTLKQKSKNNKIKSFEKWLKKSDQILL